MQKIITQEEKERRKKRNQLVIGIVLIWLMVVSTLGYAFIDRTGANSNNSNNEKIEYNGIEFIRDENFYWKFKIQETDFLTKHNPQETEDITFSGSKQIAEYRNKPMYFAGENGEHVLEIARNLNGIVLRTSNACLENDKECSQDNENFPIKKCSNENIIVFKESVNENKIYQEENCIFIETNYANQARYADKFLFSILGIQ